jgi:hypothetical protein
MSRQRRDDAIALLDLDEGANGQANDEPPLDWPDFSDGIETEFCCPRCAYSWRGDPRPTVEEDEA